MGTTTRMKTQSVTRPVVVRQNKRAQNFQRSSQVVSDRVGRIVRGTPQISEVQEKYLVSQLTEIVNIIEGNQLDTFEEVADISSNADAVSTLKSRMADIDNPYMWEECTSEEYRKIIDEIATEVDEAFERGEL